MNVAEALLEAWDRQCRIVMAVSSRIDESNRDAKPSADGMALLHQLAHIHQVRRFFLSKVAPEHAAGLGDSYVDGWSTPIQDLDAIKSMLEASGAAVRLAVRDLIKRDVGPVWGYDHPVLFLQHLVWHEGWHVGLIFLGLRQAGQEPPEAWEEEHIWGQWRTELP